MIGEEILLGESISVLVTRSHIAINNLIQFLVVLTILYLLQHFLVKFLENKKDKKLLLVIIIILFSLLILPIFNFILDWQYTFVIFFLSIFFVMGQFLIKGIENFPKNKTHYFTIFIICFILIFLMLYFAIYCGHSLDYCKTNNFLEPIIKWFNLEYSSPST